VKPKRKTFRKWQTHYAVGAGEFNLA
jgi:hypothetical protein